MKTLVLLFILSLSTFAGRSDLRMKAKEIIDRGDYSEVHFPFVHGCITGQCYGGFG